jgi:hypothetical protein
VFNEILRIKPVLDENSAKEMESSLSSRFTRIAGTFGKGLKGVIKGTVLGISLALLNKILNPIETLDEKIKGLLGQGTSITDLAERLGTSPGQLKQLQDVAASLKVTPEQFKEVITKFAEAVEKAREENANPFEAKSASTVILGDIAKQKDLVEGFKQFLTLLKTTGAGQGVDQPLTTHAQRLVNEAALRGKSLSEEDRQALIKTGELRRRTGPEAQAEFEKQVLGSQQFGGVKKLVGTDIAEQAKKINEPSQEQLTQSINKLSDLDAQKALLQVQAQTKDFLEASKKTNEDMVAALVSADARQEKETTDRLASYENLKKGADAVADLQQGFSKLLDSVTFVLAELKKITEYIPKLTNSPMVKGISKVFTKGE